MKELSKSTREQLFGLHIGAEQMSFLFGISIPTVYRWSRTGKLPSALPYTQRATWKLGDVVKWMAGHEAQTQRIDDRRAERLHKKTASEYADSLRTPEQREAHRRLYAE